MRSPKIVFCTTCKGRAQHVEQTLPQNLRDNRGSDAVFLVLDYCSSDHLAEYMYSNHLEDMDSGRVVFYQYKTEHSFRMAHAKNMSHRLGIREGGDILVNLDADNFTGEGFADYLKEAMSPTDSFMWSRMIPGVLARGISGRIVVTSDQFLCTGGYDEVYSTYSPDDKDFQARLRRLGYTPLEVDPRFLSAVRHNDKMRFSAYPEVRGKMTEDFHINQTNRVRNYGNAGCGTVWRNFDAVPIEIKPFPTRIFGIGMHKTATTSLHHAAEILGFSSGHWKNAHWAKAIWREMNTDGSSPTLEKCYALCDLPITLLYRKLDAAYPGSKFVLTVRDEASWLKSVRNHYSPEYNPQQPYWAADPFTDIIHTKLYGQSTFDAEICLRVYREHNAAVLEYFADRPNDLLVLHHTGEGKEWEKLCPFLNVSIPDVEYPKKNPSVVVPSKKAGFWGNIYSRFVACSKRLWQRVVRFITWLFGI